MLLDGSVRLLLRRQYRRAEVLLREAYAVLDRDRVQPW